MVVAIQELDELECCPAPSGDRRRASPSASGGRLLEVVEHDLAALAVEVDGAAGRQEREVGRDLVDDRAAARSTIALQAVFEAELAAVLADQVDDRQVALAGGTAQTAAELLGEHRRGRCRAKQQDAVDVGHVDAFAEHLDGEDAAQPTCPQIARGAGRARRAGRRR